MAWFVFRFSGAEKIGGRWNFRGSRVVYASENLSLATLERFVHVNPRVIPFDKNILLNPSHPQMKDVKVEPPEPFDFDPRMFA